MVQQGAASPPTEFASLSGEEAEVQCVSPTVSSHPRWQRPEPHPETPQLRPAVQHFTFNTDGAKLSPCLYDFKRSSSKMFYRRSRKVAAVAVVWHT